MQRILLILVGALVVSWALFAGGPQGADPMGHPGSQHMTAPDGSSVLTMHADIAPVVRPDPTILVDVPGFGSAELSCASCHSVRAGHEPIRSSAQLSTFHMDIDLQHGTLTCLSCHDDRDYDRLRLADGTPVAYSNVMTLCAQCHGDRVRDYEHGAHGGMVGYWDRTRGPRQRATCLDCHNPHQPAFPKMQPMFKPRDRFLEPEMSGSTSHG